jgi:hypothetical protein
MILYLLVCKRGLVDHFLIKDPSLLDYFFIIYYGVTYMIDLTLLYFLVHRLQYNLYLFHFWTFFLKIFIDQKFQR